MDILKRISIIIIFLLLSSCRDRVKSVDNQNFGYIFIIDYPQSTSNKSAAKLVFYEKDSNFKNKINEFNDFSFSYIDEENTLKKALNITLNFDNSSSIDTDMELIIDDTYYYQFKKIITEIDTIRKPKILSDELFIHKNIKAIVNDSLMEFNEFDLHSSKCIKLPFSLAKKR